MNIRLDHNVDAANPVQRDLDIFIISPVTHTGHVLSIGLVLLVTCPWIVSELSREGRGYDRRTLCKHDILVERIGKLAACFRLLPRVIVEPAFYVMSIDIAMEPDVCPLSAFP